MTETGRNPEEEGQAGELPRPPGRPKSTWGGRTPASKRTRDTGSGTKWQESGTGSKRESAGGQGEEEEGNRIRKVEKIGAGSYGEVWLVEYLGALEAHKSLGPGSRKDAFHEAVNTRSVNHPNVVKVMDVIEEDGVPALRMEYVEGENLHHHVDDQGIFPVDRLLDLMIPVADALQATHERGIVHLDLKPSNLILRKNGKDVVVTDFGISAALRLRGGELTGGRGGTPFFMAPELHEQGGAGSPQADIWSLGVTLFYLVSGIYPFPFDKLPPREAVKEPPIDLTESHHYVPRAFSRIVNRMLSVDVGARHASMAEVKNDLEDLAWSLRCPACGGIFRFESVGGVCPDPECQSEAVVPLKSGLLLQKAAGTALAECSFDEAGKEARKALAEFRKVAEREDLAEEMAAFLKALPGLKKDHDDSLAAGRDLIGKEKYIEGIHRVRSAAVRFSRSAAVKELRRDLQARCAELYRTAADTVRQKIRNREFEGARAALSRVDHLLGDKIAREEVQAGLEEELRDPAWLHDEINQQHKDFQHHQENGHQALQAFDFNRAMESFTFLESNFPSEEGRKVLSSLGRAAALYERQDRFSEEFLRQVIGEATRAGGVEQLALEESMGACNKLLEDFDPEVYPAFQAIQEKGRLFQEACDSIRGFVEKSLKQAETARNARNLIEENLVLEMIKGLVFKSDLFDSRTRAFVQDRLKVTAQGVSEAERLYHDGKQALEKREYPKALADLREARRIAPETYEDLEELIGRAESSQEEFRSLKSRVLEYLARIERGDFDLSFAVETLAAAESLYQLTGDQERGHWLKDVAGGFITLVDAQREYLVSQPDTGQARGSEVAAFFYENLVPLLDVLPMERWEGLVGSSRELRRALCELFSAVGPTGRMEFAALARLLRPLLDVMETEKAAGMLVGCLPPQGAIHPGLAWGEQLLVSFGRDSHTSRNLHFHEAEEILGRLRELCPAELREKAERNLAELRRKGRKASLVTRLHRIKDWTHQARYAIGAAVLAALLFFFIGKGVGRSGAFAWVPAEVGRIGLDDPGLEDHLASLVEEADRPEEITRRIGLLQGWASLKDAFTGGDGERLTSLLSAAALHRKTLEGMDGMGEESHAGRMLAGLRDALVRDIEKGSLILVDTFVKTAADKVSTGSPDTVGSLPILRSRLKSLQVVTRLDKLDALVRRLAVFESLLEERILTPLRGGMLRDFKPEELTPPLSLADLGLPREVRLGLTRVLRMEIRRALVVGLQDCVDGILRSGKPGDLDLLLFRVGEALARLGRLGAIEDKRTRNATLKRVSGWVNTYFGD